ncbi:MAG: hypothetical protein ABJL67_13610 [Sulfitobacter sp.]
MSGPNSLSHEELSQRFSDLKTFHRELLDEFNADGVISEEEQARLAPIQAKLAEIERKLAEGSGNFFTDALDAVAGAGSDAIDAAGGFVERASDAVDGAVETAGGVIEGIGDAVSGAAGLVGDAIEGAVDIAETALETFTGTAIEIANAARQAAADAAGGAEDAISQAASTLRDTAQGALQELIDRAQEASRIAEQAANEAEEAVGETVESLRTRAEQAAEDARTAANEAAQKLQSTLTEAAEHLRDTGQQIVDRVESAAGQAEDAIETAVEEARDAAEDAAQNAETQVREMASAARDYATDVLGRLGNLVTNARTTVEDALADLVTEAEEFAESAEEAARRLTGTYYTEEENVVLAELEASGLDQQERQAIVDQTRDNPAVLEQARIALARMDSLNVPAADRGELFAMSQTNLAGFETAMEVVAGMESGGALDVSDDAMADLAVQMDDARRDWRDANRELKALLSAGAPQAEIDAKEAEVNGFANVWRPLNEDFSRREEKRGLLDALSFGPLSLDRPDPMEPEDVNALIEAYGRNPDVANAAIELAGNAEDPSLIAQNVEGVLDISETGFAGPDGTALTETERGEFNGMAANMLRNGAAMGQEYFDGATDYYDSGAQALPDPCGGRTGADVAQVNLERTKFMADAMVNDAGEVSATTPEAQGAMDHMLYHPGSLAADNFSPNVTAQMTGVYDLFSNPETAVDANAVISEAKAPGDEVPNGDAARNIVAETLGILPEDVGDTETREAILSGMLTPLQQGSVGSCFASGPTRRLSLEDPIQTMRNMTEIATTGQFTSPAMPDTPIPANQNIPAGENPMMRSYEFTIASGSAMLEDSYNHNRLDNALWEEGNGGRGLGEIEGMVGSEAWEGSGELDENGDLVDGVRATLQRELRQQLRFDYNAVELDNSSGSGDGSSSHGVFQVIYQGSPIDSEDGFQNAIQTIALGAVGDTDDATRNAVIELVQSDAFVDSIYAAYGTDRTEAPWNLAGGGFGNASEQVLTGREEEPSVIAGDSWFSDSNGPAGGILSGLVESMGGNDGLSMLSTNGDRANHAFMGTPDHPSFQAISGEDSEERIQEILLDPGQEIASNALSEQETSRIYEQQLRKMLRWRSVSNDDASVALLTTALRDGPTEGMTPSDLESFIEDQLEDFDERQRVYEQERTDEWQASQTPPASDEDAEKHRAALEKASRDRADSLLTTSLIAATDPPYVVVADTNWGNHNSQTQFVIGPDPRSGELRLFSLDTITGEMALQGENWEESVWRSYEE